MILQNDFSVAAPMERVYDALTDAAVVVPSLPGARRTGRGEDDRTAKGELRITLGKVTIPYRGTLRLDEGDREAGALTLTIDAREGRGQGLLHASVDVRLRESHGATMVSLRSEVDVDGRAAKVPESDVRAAVQQLLSQFGEGIEARLNGSASQPAPVVEGGGNGVQIDAQISEEAAAPAAAWAEPELPGVHDEPRGALEPAEVDEPPGAAAPHLEVSASPAPAPPPHQEPPVAGRVRIMTDEPLPYESIDTGEGLLDLVRAQLRRRPWLAPLLLLGGLALLLLTRRSRRG